MLVVQIECAERLVEEQEARSAHESLCEARQLPLTAR